MRGSQVRACPKFRRLVLGPAVPGRTCPFGFLGGADRTSSAAANSSRNCGAKSYAVKTEPGARGQADPRQASADCTRSNAAGRGSKNPPLASAAAATDGISSGKPPRPSGPQPLLPSPALSRAGGKTDARCRSEAQVSISRCRRVTCRPPGPDHRQVIPSGMPGDPGRRPPEQQHLLLRGREAVVGMLAPTGLSPQGVPLTAHTDAAGV